MSSSEKDWQDMDKCRHPHFTVHTNGLTRRYVCNTCDTQVDEKDIDVDTRRSFTVVAEEPSEDKFIPDELEEWYDKKALEEVSEAEHRKQRPVYSGVMRYFPKAMLEVANCSYVANEQHNPGKPMHWNRSKSPDELDALARHLLEAGTMDDDGIRHSTKVAWRALANLEKELEEVDSGR